MGQKGKGGKGGKSGEEGKKHHQTICSGIGLQNVGSFRLFD